MRRSLAVLVTLAGALSATVAAACPCGCGSIAVGMLEPGQTTKFITSATQESNVATVDPDGTEIGDYYYERSLRTDVALTQALFPRSAVTVGVGAYRNEKDGEASSPKPSDASISLGYTVLQQDFMREWIPRLDATLSYKHALAKSFHDAEADPTAESFLEVGGNGLQEVALGTQAWFGMHEWKVGSSLRYVTFPEVMQAVADGPQAGGMAAVQIAKVFTGRGGLSIESGMEWLGETMVDNEAVPGSSRRIDHASVSGSAVIWTHHSLGLTLSRRNAFGLTRNATAGRSVTLSYQAIFL